MHERLKAAASVVFGIAIVCALGSLLFVFIKGATWAADNMLRPLIDVGWWMLALNGLIMLPLSIFRRLRPVMGAGLFLSSYLYGLIAWLSGFVFTYMLWGLWAVIVGLLLLGGGVVPMGLLATLLKGEWNGFVPLVVLVLLTFGTRVGGLLIAQSGGSKLRPRGST